MCHREDCNQKARRIRFQGLHHCSALKDGPLHNSMGQLPLCFQEDCPHNRGMLHQFHLGSFILHDLLYPFWVRTRRPIWSRGCIDHSCNGSIGQYSSNCILTTSTKNILFLEDLKSLSSPYSLESKMTSLEHFSRFTYQCGKASGDDFMKLRLFRVP